jgi:hypothetical protein
MSSNKKAAILVIISFLTVALLFSSLSRSDVVFAKSNITYGEVQCENFGDFTVKCCQNQTDSSTGKTTRYCTTCNKTNPPSNCSPRYVEAEDSSLSTGLPPTNELPPSPPPPPKNVLPPSSTITCPDGSAPDASGNCPPPPAIQTLKQQPSSDSDNIGKLKGESKSKKSNDNNDSLQPEDHHHHKGNNLGHVGEQDSTTKKGSDGGSDVSQTNPEKTTTQPPS